MTKLAFVGCGGIQHEHCRHLAAMDDIQFTGHCDSTLDRATESAERYGGAAFTDFAAMFDTCKPDAVYICVPPYAHGPIEEAAAERGIHLFIEKPIALDAATAKRVAETVRKSGVIVTAGYCWRYFDTVAHARRYLKGQITCVFNGYWHGAMPEVWWWRRMDKSGGQIVEQTTHLIDLARYLLGEVAEVHAMASTGCMSKVKDFTVHDASVVSLRMKSGATGAITSSCVARNGARAGLEIMTTDAALTITPDRLVVKETGKRTEYTANVNVYAEESRAFIEAVRSGKRGKLKSSYADALKTLLVTCAANESIQSGLPVKP